MNITTREQYENDILDLIGLCLKVNAETKHTVFVRFSGHVNDIDIDIRLNGYSGKHDEVKKFEYIPYYTEKEKTNYYSGCYFEQFKEQPNIIIDFITPATNYLKELLKDKLEKVSKEQLEIIRVRDKG